MPIGTVKRFYDEKGFGFITQEGVETDIFVHHTSIQMEGFRTLKPGQSVRFQTKQGSKGITAVDVEVIPEADATKRCKECGHELRAG